MESAFASVGRTCRGITTSGPLLFLVIAGCSAPPQAIESPQVDSRPIVFTSFHTRPDGYRTEMVLTVSRDGSGLDTVFVGGDHGLEGMIAPPGLGPEFPAWSPDGEWIAFRGEWATVLDTVRETPRGTLLRSPYGQVFIVRKDGSGLRQLTNDAFYNSLPDWSPDGRWIVYSSEREDGTDLFVVDTAGSITWRLTNRPGIDSGADWSPDGNQLVFASDREEGRGAYIMDADGSNVRWLAAGTKPTWSPDGRRIAFHARTCEMIEPRARGDDDLCRATGTFGIKGNWALWIIDPDGSNLKRVWPSEGDFAPVRTADGRYRSSLGEYPLYPVWSPDGTHLAFHAPRPFYARDPDMQAAVDRLVLTDSVFRESEEDLTKEEFEWLYANTLSRAVSVFVVDTAGLDAREVVLPPDIGGHPEWH